MSDKSSETCERIIQTGFHVDMLENLTSLSVDILNNSQSKSSFVKAHIGTLLNVERRAKTGCSALRQHRAVDVLQKFRDAKNQVTFIRLEARL